MMKNNAIQHLFDPFSEFKSASYQCSVILNSGIVINLTFAQLLYIYFYVGVMQI